MSYDPTEPAPKDVIRGWAGDTSNDVDSEILPDTMYLAVLSRHGAEVTPGSATDTASFYRAAADLLRRTAVVIQANPSSISAPSDGSISWANNRTTALEAKAKELDAMAEADDAGGDDDWGIVTVRSAFLTGGGAETW